MEYSSLTPDGPKVSRLCLGTMTFGEQNTESEAHDQLDLALDHGVNFIDTAEMYPVPPKAETQGRTESYVGSWLAGRQDRDQLIIATKASGPGDWMSHIRNGPRFSAEHLQAAVESSLQRLQTDYIDLYQLHWPERDTNFFGKLGYSEEATNEGAISLQETLEALAPLVESGKIRHIGLSNETPWGVMECIRQAEQKGLPRIVSIQNPYNLLNRSFEVGLAEISIRENVGLLAYSPMAFGALSGKYLNGQWPEGARMTLFERFQRYQGANAEKAISRYVEIAQDHGLDPAQMSLAFVTSRPFVTSNIIGATRRDQLESNLNSIDVKLSTSVLEAIEAVHREISNPCP